MNHFLVAPGPVAINGLNDDSPAQKVVDAIRVKPLKPHVLVVVACDSENRQNYATLFTKDPAERGSTDKTTVVVGNDLRTPYST
jgi:hypothetical protein